MKISALLVLALIPVLSHAADKRWEEAASGPDHDTYLDYSTVVRKGQAVQVWQMSNFGAVQPDPSGEFVTAVQLMEFRCDRRESRVRQLVHYAGPMATGKIVRNFGKNPSAEWNAVLPGSVRETNMLLACSPEAAKAKRDGTEPVSSETRKMISEKLVDSCMRRQYMTLVIDDAAKSGKAAPEGLTVESLPLEKMRAGFQADPSLRNMDKIVVSGCECAIEPMRQLFAKAATQAQLKALTVQIKNTANDPAAIARVKQCWTTANAMKGS